MFEFRKGVLLKDYCTFGIGGPARYFLEVKNVETMYEAIRYCYQVGLPFFVLGKGSNTLFDDLGFDGVVLVNRIDTVKEQEGNTLTVGAGYSFPRLVGQVARKGFSGLEFASGIPATIGGAIYMNAGANGMQTADTLVGVGFITEKGEWRFFDKRELEFGYRFSSFQAWNGVIVEAVFALTPSESASSKQKTILDYRLKTQPYKEKSAGCAFRNPPGECAGKLIEACGLKGLQCGGAKVSTLHANFIVNCSNATAKDVHELMRRIREVVWEQKGVLLEEEVRFIPYGYSRFSR